MSRVKHVVRDAIGLGLAAARITRPRARHAGRLVVVTFHRVLPEALRRQYPYPNLAVTPEELSWYLDYFRGHYTCGTLAECHARHVRGERPEWPLLAITFDDGQLDNHEHALPVLDAVGLKASFFIPTGHVERSEPIWHDRLGFAVLAAGRSEAALAELRALYSASGVGPPEARDPISHAAETAKQMTPAKRADFVAEIERCGGGVGLPAWAGLMQPQQIRQLSEGGHEVGSHTVNHVLLPQCAPEELASELTESRRALEEWTGNAVESFCYPNGDSSADVAAAVGAAGYLRAVTTRWGTNDQSTDPMSLHRCDLDGARVRGVLTGALSEPLLAYRLSGLFPGTI